jgi:hypothetical protein
MRTLALALLVTALAACGSETPAAAPKATNLLVSVDLDGHGSARAKSVRLRCPGAGCAITRRVKTSDFAATPTGQACSMIYGGPETATVKGTLRGDAIDARFSRTDGCQTSRWERVKALLSAP